MVRSVSGALAALVLGLAFAGPVRAETTPTRDAPQERVFLQLSGLG